MRSFWVTCNACNHTWVVDFVLDHGALYPTDEECIECGSNDLELDSGGEYFGAGGA